MDRAHRTFHVRGVLAIPAGHRVEISIFALNVGAFRAKLEPQLHDPLIRDLSTGVVYGRTWHYAQQDTTDVALLPMAVRGDLAVVERVVGEVLGARVVSGLLGEDAGRQGWVTTLIVAVEPPGAR